MVGIDYKSKLVFYQYTEDVDKELKNGRVRTQKVKFGGPMTQERYVKEILPIVQRRKAQLMLEGKEMIFQEDNDGSHGTRSSDNICVYKKDEMELDYIDDWPANSPDLNAIENVWRILKSRVKLHHSQTPEELRKAIQKEWDLISYDEINHCILGAQASKQAKQKQMSQRGVKTTDCCIQNRV